MAQPLHPELVCPAGTLPGLKAAVDNGADCVHLGFRDETNARNFGGLNFDARTAAEGIRYAHARNVKVLVAINTYAQPGTLTRWTDALDLAAALDVDAVILADPGLMRHAVERHPELRLHLSVQASATTYEAINFYVRHFGIRRAVLPRVLSLAQVEHVVDNADTQIEVRLQGVLLDRFAKGATAGYPTLYKGRSVVRDDTYYAIEEPTSLDTLDLLPELVRIGIAAVKIEGRQRSPAYVASVTRTWRAAIDACAASPSGFAVREAWRAELAKLSEGQRTTLGALHRSWR